MRFLRHRLFFIFLFLSIYLNVYAQEYSFTKTIDNSTGLHSNNVSFLTFDKYGFLWFRSGDEAMCYDGKEIIRRFQATKNDSINGKIGPILSDKAKNIYIVNNLQLDKINSSLLLDKFLSKDLANKYSSLNTKAGFDLGLEFMYQRYLNSTEGKKYISNMDKMVYLDDKDNKVVLINVNPKKNNYLVSYIQNHDSCILICKNDCKILYRGKTIGIFDKIVSGKFNIDVKTIKYIGRFTEETFFTCNQGLFQWNTFTDGKLTQLLNYNQIPKEYIHYVVLSSNKDYLFISTNIKGIYQYQRTSVLSKVVPSNFVTPSQFTYPISANSTWTKIFLSTPTNGSFNSILKLGDNLYTNNGYKWTQDGNFIGLSKLPFCNYSQDYIKINNGRFYIPASKQLLLAKSETQYHSISSVTDFNASPFIIYNDTIVGYNEIEMFQIYKDKIHLFESKLNIKKPLIKSTFDIALHNDTFWLCTSEGIYIAKKAPKLKAIPYKFNNLDVRRVDILPGNAGLLFYFYGNGVKLYKNGIFYNDPNVVNEDLRYVHYSYTDKHNRIWLATNNGIYCTSNYSYIQSFFNRNIKPYFLRLTKEDGLSTNEFNSGTRNAYLYNKSNGLLYLSSVNGLNFFNPNTIKLPFPKNPIKVVTMQIDNEIASSVKDLPPYFMALKINVKVAYYGNRENINLEWKEDISNTWKPLEDNNFLIYVRRQPGFHKITIRYKNGFSPSNYVMKEIYVHVNPMFHEDSFNQIIVAIIFILSIVATVIIRDRYQIKKRRILEKLVEERTSDLNTTMVELKESEENLRMSDDLKEKLINMLVHDIRSPLSSLIFVGDHLYDHLNKEGSQIEPETIQMMLEIKKAHHNMWDYANDFLIWHDITNGVFKPKSENYSLTKIVNQILSVYNQIIERNGNNVELNIQSDADIHIDHRILQVVIRNLIDNANKYTVDNMIQIFIYETQKLVVFEIKNKSKAFTPDDINTLETVFNSNQKSTHNRSFKFGIQLIAFLTSIIGIERKFIYDHSGVVTFQLKFQKI